MKLTVEAGPLGRALSKLKGALDRRRTIPVLAFVRLEATTDRAVLAATDTSIWRRTELAVTVAEPGAALLPAERALGIVKTLAERTVVTIEATDGKSLTLATDQLKWKVPTEPAADFPVFPDLPTATSPVNRALMARALDLCAHVVSDTDGRYNTGGLRFLDSGERTSFVATDGHRLSFVGAEETSGGPVDVILPKPSLRELANFLAAADADHVQFGHDDYRAFFRHETETLVITKIDGSFPDHTRIMPRQNTLRAAVDRDVLIAAIQRIELASDKAVKTMTIFLTKDQGVLSTESPAGEIRETVPVDYAGEDVTVVLQAQYVREAVAVTDAASIAIQLKDGLAPVIFKPAVTAEGFDYICIVMPCRA